MSKITKITAFFLFFVVGFCVKDIKAIDLNLDDTILMQQCPEGFSPCCDTGEFYCKLSTERCLVKTCSWQVERPGDGELIKPVETCTKGATQNKYTASGCTYKTETRTCCGLSWSEWDKDCPEQTCNACPSSTKPKTSQECTMSNGSTGTQTRTVECNFDTCSWKTPGSWSTCKCNKTCGGDLLDAANCQCCAVGCYYVKGTAPNLPANGGMFCNCISTSYAISNECCTTNQGEFRLPNGYSDCSTFAKDAGLTMSNIYADRHMCARNTW